MWRRIFVKVETGLLKKDFKMKFQLNHNSLPEPWLSTSHERERVLKRIKNNENASKKLLIKFYLLNKNIWTKISIR